MIDYAKRLRDAADLLNRVAKDLMTIAKDLRPPITVKSVRGLFTYKQLDLVKVTDEGGFVKVTPREFLESVLFADIAGRIKKAGGEYVSAGKESHFRIPKEAKP